MSKAFSYKTCSWTKTMGQNTADTQQPPPEHRKIWMAASEKPVGDADEP